MPSSEPCIILLPMHAVRKRKMIAYQWFRLAIEVPQIIEEKKWEQNRRPTVFVIQITSEFLQIRNLSNPCLIIFCNAEWELSNKEILRLRKRSSEKKLG